MNTVLALKLVTLWSFRRELMYVALAFILILLSPVFAVIILTNTGINIVSDTLVHVDSSTNTVSLFDPTGGKYKDLAVTTSWPVKGVVTLEFAQSDLPYQPFHTGIDIANPEGKIGDNITPMMSGTITYAGELSWGYGKHVIIDHGDNVTAVYAHLSKIYVFPGEKVTPTTIIGQEGQTGWATGPHLHFEVRVFDIPVNPRSFVSGNP